MLDNSCNAPASQPPLESIVPKGANPPDVTGLQVWEAALCFSLFLNVHPALVLDRTVVELGAGTGLVALSIARRARKVLLTDGDESVVRLLCYNRSLNNAENISSERYVWGARRDLSGDVVIACEVAATEGMARNVVAGASAVRDAKLFVVAHTVRRAITPTGLDTEDTALAALKAAACTAGWQLIGEENIGDDAAARRAGGDAIICLHWRRE